MGYSNGAGRKLQVLLPRREFGYEEIHWILCSRPTTFRQRIKCSQNTLVTSACCILHPFDFHHDLNPYPNSPVEFIIVYETKVLAVALSYLHVGGRTPTVL